MIICASILRLKKWSLVFAWNTWSSLVSRAKTRLHFFQAQNWGTNYHFTCFKSPVLKRLRDLEQFCTLFHLLTSKTFEKKFLQNLFLFFLRKSCFWHFGLNSSVNLRKTGKKGVIRCAKCTRKSQSMDFRQRLGKHIIKTHKIFLFKFQKVLIFWAL